MIRKAMRACAVLALVLVLASGCTTLPALLASRPQKLVAEGDRLAATGREAEAILAYRQAVDLDAKDPAALRKLAAAYAAQGRARLAGRYYRQALALQPGNAGLGNELASVERLDPVEAGLASLWQVPAGDSPPVGLAVANDTVYVALEDGQLIALAGDTGHVRWRARLPGGATSGIGTGQGLVLVGSQDGQLRAFDQAGGRPVWSFTAKAPLYAAPLVAGELVYAPAGDGTLYALAAKDGALRWQYATGGPLHGGVALAGGVVYWGSTDDRIYAADAATGAPRWGTGIPTQGAVESQPVVAAGRVFAGSGDARLYALAEDHGGEYWRYSTADAIFATPLVVSQTVYLASNGQALAALDALTGEPRWEIDAPGPVAYTPALAGRSLYVLATASPYLYSVDSASGRLQWKMPIGDWPGSAPVAAGGRLYLATKDGTVLAYQVPQE